MELTDLLSSKFPEQGLVHGAARARDGGEEAVAEAGDVAGEQESLVPEERPVLSVSG
jgi:hypothetical protein